MQDKPLWFGQVKRWYDSVRWRKARAMFLRYSPLCCMCSKRGMTVVATIVDHKIPHKGDYDLFWNQDNWQSLCASCHSGVKRIQENHGYSQQCGVDGVPIDAGHPWNKGK
jgi:5-methylcytosine-specific restriction enzyme A